MLLGVAATVAVDVAAVGVGTLVGVCVGVGVWISGAMLGQTVGVGVRPAPSSSRDAAIVRSRSTHCQYAIANSVRTSKNMAAIRRRRKRCSFSINITTSTSTQQLDSRF